MSKKRIQHFKSYFTARRAVLEEIAKGNWWPLSWTDEPGQSYDPHYHVFTQYLYIMKGSLTLTDEKTEESFTARKGDKVIIPARRIHSGVTHTGAIYLVGMSRLVPFDEFEVPV